MSGNDYLKIWHYAQLGITLFFIVVIAIWETVHTIQLSAFVITVGIFFVLSLMGNFVKRKPQWLTIIMNWLKAIIQPIALILVWAIVTRQIIVHTGLAVRGVISLSFIIYIIMFIPFAGTVAKHFTNPISRIIFLLYWFYIVLFMPRFVFPPRYAGPMIYQWMIESGFIFSLALFLLVVVAMRTWHLSWPGIAPRYQEGTRWWIVLILILIPLIYISLISATPDYQEVLHKLMTFNFHELGINKLFLLTALRAGISEEVIFRFGLIGVLLGALKNHRGRIAWSLLISSLIFGGMHLINLRLQPIGTTLLQVAFAFGLGLLFACVYLYTGQLWLTILFHFLVDFPSFVISHGIVSTATVSSASLITITILVLIFASPLWWLLVGKNRLVMQRHADHLSGTNQHFDYKMNF